MKRLYASPMAWVAIGLLLFACRTAHASSTGETAVSEAMAAVERGAFDEAVDTLELLADRGFVHPDASLARAHAYIERARSRAGKPGDLGRAVAALEETRLFEAGNEQVDSALEKVRAEIGRRRAREAKADVIQRPALGRAVVALLSENAWAFLCAVGSSFLTAGLVLRLFVRRRGAEIAGAVGVVTGLLLAFSTGLLAATARHYRVSTRPAVVVVSEARWLDELGRPLPRAGRQSEAVPEGAYVHVREQRDGRSHIEWGALEGWVNASQLRLLEIPRPEAP